MLLSAGSVLAPTITTFLGLQCSSFIGFANRSADVAWEIMSLTDRKLLFVGSHVLDASQLRENWFSGPPHMMSPYQTRLRASRGHFWPVFPRFGRGRGRWTARQGLEAFSAAAREPHPSGPGWQAGSGGPVSVGQDVFVVGRGTGWRLERSLLAQGAEQSVEDFGGCHCQG